MSGLQNVLERNKRFLVLISFLAVYWFSAQAVPGAISFFISLILTLYILSFIVKPNYVERFVPAVSGKLIAAVRIVVPLLLLFQLYRLKFLPTTLLPREAILEEGFVALAGLTIKQNRPTPQLINSYLKRNTGSGRWFFKNHR